MTDSSQHAFLSGTNGGVLNDFGTLVGGNIGLGYGVNNSGQVVGTSYFNISGEGGHAFLSGVNGGPLKDLGTLGGGNSDGLGINDAGQVVGDSYLATPGVEHAFLFSQGVMTDLNSLIAFDPDFTLNYASGISNTGFIAGSGVDALGQEHAFLLTPTSPVPEISTMISFGLLLTLSGLTIAIMRKNATARSHTA